MKNILNYKKWILIGGGLFLVLSLFIVGVGVWVVVSLIPALIPSQASLDKSYGVAQNVYQTQVKPLSERIPQVCKKNAQILLDKSLAMNVSALIFQGPALLSECLFPDEQSKKKL